MVLLNKRGFEFSFAWLVSHGGAPVLVMAVFSAGPALTMARYRPSQGTRSPYVETSLG